MPTTFLRSGTILSPVHVELGWRRIEAARPAELPVRWAFSMSSGEVSSTKVR